ncbi:hypothetical protein N9F40_01275 [bacterium]|nr:hypothetical protein [bacterium]|tara:strand:- start:10436 stop:10651 length:216 start_codon:yes stop_codon:yes gene_type:complete
MEGAASWRRLLDVVDIDASEVLDNVLRTNVSTTDEAREDAFHDKVIRVRCDAMQNARGRSRLTAILAHPPR